MRVIWFSAFSMYLILSWSFRTLKQFFNLLILEWRSSRISWYLWQHIKKCRSSSITFVFETKHVLCSTGIAVPRFSYFPVCILNEWVPRLRFVRLNYCVGWISNFLQIIFHLVILFNFFAREFLPGMWRWTTLES